MCKDRTEDDRESIHGEEEMMNVEELEVKIKDEKANLVKLEAAYEKEEDEKKTSKLEYSISRKEDAIDALIDRQQHLIERETEDEEKQNPKDKDAEEEDEDVCPECGGDLQEVGEENGVAVFECVRCHELFLDK